MTVFLSHTVIQNDPRPGKMLAGTIPGHTSSQQAFFDTPPHGKSDQLKYIYFKACITPSRFQLNGHKEQPSPVTLTLALLVLIWYISHKVFSCSLYLFTAVLRVNWCGCLIPVYNPFTLSQWRHCS